MSAEIKASTLEFLGMSKNFFSKDFKALTPQQQASSPGGAARTPIDIAYECAVVNRAILERMNGGDPKRVMAGVAKNPEGFIIAPEGLSATEAIAEFESSCVGIMDAVEAKPDGELTEMVQTSMGTEPYFSLACFAGTHNMYHCGQLALVQAIGGDGANHWMD
jgi:hypothetical protein